MGVCFSKKRDPSSPTKALSNNLPKQNDTSVKEEKEEPKVAEKKPVLSAATPALRSKKAFVAEEKERKEGEIPAKNSSQAEEEQVCKVAAAADEQQPAPLTTSSCTKEELDAILIQCGRLSRSSSGRTSKETDGGRQRRYSGSKRSYDFDNEGRKEQEVEQDNQLSRPSPRRRAPNRERSGSRERGNSRERRVSRSPGKRSEGPVSNTSVSDKQRQQPAKMVSVPAREKGASFVSGDVGGGNLGAKRATVTMPSGGLRSASPRSRSPANNTRPSNENAQLQSLSRNSSRKAEQSPCRRNPLAEIDDSSLRNQNGDSDNGFQKNREVDEGVRKQASTIYSFQKPGEGISQICSSDLRNSSHVSVSIKQQQLKKQEILEEERDAKTAIEIESHIPRTLTRTRSSRRSSRDLDNNSGLNPTSYASLLLEDIQNQQQQHHTAFSLPACISKACSILDAVADLNSSCSERRSYEADQSTNKGGFTRRGILARREPFLESELVVKDDLIEPSLHKYVTVREIRRDLEPQESAGSNSFEGQPWASMWEMNSVDSAGGIFMTGNMTQVEVGEEDEVGQAGNQQQQKSWQRSGASSCRRNFPADRVTAATPRGR
ncbi:uncharacterized protein At1g65710-like [Phalaenopsis equestris]|uniref:uncharacterized protein At1g65710-like n=1 Tax=Phalaenopsis equestris TaxID=78828 RepID=UPI0009E29D9B|nr:uncharacterized protein At1g65710-like [Phalaenopsis equestris]